MPFKIDRLTALTSCRAVALCVIYGNIAAPGKHLLSDFPGAALSTRWGRRSGGILMIAALFVQKNGAYYGLDGVDPWDEERDARLYAGPWPVVAHPPCARWSRLAGFTEARFGLMRGDDGGCFSSAVASVRKFGGVLEHPAFTRAFSANGLPVPVGGGWQATICGGWVCRVEQGRYGHPTSKDTWLFASKVSLLPSLDWRLNSKAGQGSWLGLSSDGKTKTKRLNLKKNLRSATPDLFKEILLNMARSVR